MVGPYDVVFSFPPITFPGERPGGKGSSDGVSYNVGAVYDVTSDLTLFGNFSQGFAIPSIGFVGNNVDPGVSIVGSELIEPVITDSYEIGVRGRFGDVEYAVAGYHTTSDFATTVSIDQTEGVVDRDRAPVRIYGTEISADWQATDQFTLQGALTWVLGEVDPNDTDDFIAISTQDVPPLKLTLTPSYTITEDWQVSGQLFYVADRESGFNAGTDPRTAEGYTLVDISTTYQLDCGNKGASVVNLQVTNLFNEDYIPPGEVTFFPDRVRPGLGRAISLSYQHTF